MKKTLFLLCHLMLCLTVLGQTRHFYTSERLSSNLITCICQDKSGYIWIGTEYGLNRYDGYRFTNYLHDANDPFGLTFQVNLRPVLMTLSRKTTHIC